jgi:hypothetical protein
MNVGLCSGRHVVTTNEGEEMDMFIFDAPVALPTATDVHEKVCRDFIKFMFANFTKLFPYRGIHQNSCYCVNLYITGLTPLLTSFLKCWLEQQERIEMSGINLVLWHWDTETKQYIPQQWAMIT